jgi:hypothetical protein
MKNKTATANDNSKTSFFSRERHNRHFLLYVAGWVGVVIATPFFLWVPLGLIGLAPSMIDVFGIVGLRTPAAVTIAGLMLAAVGFHQV